MYQFPMVQKTPKARIIRRHVLELPEKGLQERRMIGHAIKHFGGCQAVTLKHLDEGRIGMGLLHHIHPLPAIDMDFQ